MSSRYRTLTELRNDFLDIRDSLGFLSYITVTLVPDRYESGMADIDDRSSPRCNMLEKLDFLITTLDGIIASINYLMVTGETPSTPVALEELINNFNRNEYDYYLNLVRILSYNQEEDIDLLQHSFSKYYGKNNYSIFKDSRTYKLFNSAIYKVASGSAYINTTNIVEKLKKLPSMFDARDVTDIPSYN